jgi:hypothetical protein
MELNGALNRTIAVEGTDGAVKEEIDRRMVMEETGIRLKGQLVID